MKYEVFDSKNKRVFITKEMECIHTKSEIDSMNKAGYKFKINNKSITKTKLLEFIEKGLK